MRELRELGGREDTCVLDVVISYYCFLVGRMVIGKETGF